MEKSQVNILLVTPYLSGRAFRDLANDPEELQKQMEFYGLEKGKISGKEIEENFFLRETEKHDVYIDARESPEHMFERSKNANLIIAGCTREQERDVNIWSKTGSLLARCSMFYPGPSKYTKRLPEQSGYAFDLPKSYSVINGLLASDDFLTALLKREQASIESALVKVNASLKEPVICTPYLRKALTLSQEERIDAYRMIEENPIDLLRALTSLGRGW